MTTTIIPARERAQAPIGLPYMRRSWRTLGSGAISPQGLASTSWAEMWPGSSPYPSRSLPTVSGTPSWAGTPISATPRGSEG